MSEEKGIMMLHCQECHGAVFQVFKVFALGDKGGMAFYGTECCTCGTMKEAGLNSVFEAMGGESAYQ